MSVSGLGIGAEGPESIERSLMSQILLSRLGKELKVGDHTIERSLCQTSERIHCNMS